MNVDVEKLKDRIKEIWQPTKQALDDFEAGKLTREFGQALIDLRAALRNGPRGAFSKWLDSVGIDKNRAQYCIRVVEGKVTRSTSKSEPNKFTKRFLDAHRALRNAAAHDISKFDRISTDLKELLRDEIEFLRPKGEQPQLSVQLQEVGVTDPVLTCVQSASEAFPN